MKKITLLIALCFLSYGITAQEASGFTVEQNWLDACTSGTLTFQDFVADLNTPTNCGQEVSSNGGSCFEAGQLQEGFSITIEDGGDVAYFPSNTNGNNEPKIVGNEIDRFTILNFSRPNITRVSLNLYSDTQPDGVIRVFDTNGTLFETLDVNNIAGPDSVFFGISATVPIGSLELETSIDSGYGIANIRYGNCVEDCTPTPFFPEGSFPFNIEIDPGSTSTADCDNAPNLIPITVNSLGTIGIDAALQAIALDIEHTFTGDLDISIISPAGTELLIVADQGGGVDNGYQGTQFADDAGDITEATAPYGQAFFAFQGGRFDTTFFGESITGDWLIKICDDTGGDTGQVLNALIAFCAQEEVNPPPNDLIENAIDVDELGFPYTDSDIDFPNATGDSVTNSNGCDISDIFNTVWYKFTTTADGLVTASFTTNDPESAVIFFTAADENATLNSLTVVNIGGDTCQFNDGATFEAIGNQTYYVAVLSSEIGSITIESDALLSTEENTIEGFSFFPNPVEDVLNINATQSVEQITLYNITGQKVMDQKINTTNTQLSLGNLPTGIYLMKATSGSVTSTYQVIKK